MQPGQSPSRPLSPAPQPPSPDCSPGARLAPGLCRTCPLPRLGTPGRPDSVPAEDPPHQPPGWVLPGRLASSAGTGLPGPSSTQSGHALPTPTCRAFRTATRTPACVLRHLGPGACSRAQDGVPGRRVHACSPQAPGRCRNSLTPDPRSHQGKARRPRGRGPACFSALGVGREAQVLRVRFPGLQACGEHLPTPPRKCTHTQKKSPPLHVSGLWFCFSYFEGGGQKAKLST